MATIVQQTQPVDIAPTEAFGIVKTILSWFVHNFFLIGILVLLGIIAGVIIVIFFLNEEKKKEQEDMLYKEYKNTIASCTKNRVAKMYSKKYSKLNIFFCLGFPLIKKNVGRKIFDKRQNFVGYYDGMFIDDLGNHNLLMWKDKTFIFFKDSFVLRLPTNVFNLEIDSKKSTDNEVKYKVKKTQLPKGMVNISEYDLTINISMSGVRKQGYYFYPVYEDAEFNVLNLQESINAMNKINHSDELLLSVIKEGGKQVLGMTKQNVGLVYEQRVPEKVRDVEGES